jgi:hypothetical protein
MATSEMPAIFNITADDLLRTVASVEVEFFQDAKDVRTIRVHMRNGELQVLEVKRTYAARCKECNERHWAEWWCACPSCGKSHNKEDGCD